MNCTCEKCGKSMDEANFYTYKDGSKVEICKKCLTMHIDNFNPDTYLWILEKLDLPYLPEEWNNLRDKAFAKDPYKMNGMSVIGKYISKMKLKQWIDPTTKKPYTWADSEKLQELKGQKKEIDAKQRAEMDAMVQERFDKGEITEAEYKTLMSTETQNEKLAPMMPASAIGVNNNFNENNYISEDELVDPAAELTQEDKIYLAMKWGRLYKPHEWIELEKHYNEMMSGFDIQDPDTKNTLMLLCKTDLKMNQAIDIGDFDGFQKLSRVSDSLRKSAKFTAAQNKEEKGDFVDSIGEFVAMCEREGGFIPRYVTDAPKDVIDIIIQDNKEYLQTLIHNDTNLSQQIEQFLKKKEILLQQKEDRKLAKLKGLDTVEVTDQDYADFYKAMKGGNITEEEGDEDA